MDSIMYYKGKRISDLSQDEIDEIIEEYQKEIFRYSMPIKVMSLSDMAFKGCIPDHSGITGSHGFPSEIIVENFTLGLRVCPWCRQQIYIGKQIKNIVVLSCPCCGGSLES